MVRDPAGHPDLSGDGVTVAAGDVTQPASVASIAAGHDAAVNAAGRMDVPAEEFYLAATHALLGELPGAGVERLVAVGIGTTLEVAPGVRVLDTPDFPADAKAFSLGHAAELDALRAAETDLDWLVIAPPPTLLDAEAPRTGKYRVGGEQVLPAEADTPPFPYADLAVAVIDEIETPKHHRTMIAVAGG